MSVTTPVPVIIDTDIGTDIDDTWALAMALNCPEIDIRLIVSATHDTAHRAALVARLLTVAGRDDIPVGVGVRGADMEKQPQATWLNGFDGTAYPNWHEDGVGALIDAIMASEEVVTLVAIGPLTNVAEALRREPRIAERARFVGMHGSIYRGYKDAAQPMPEYNVFIDVDAARTVFAAPWHKLITPLDTCGTIVLKGDDYQRVRAATGPLIQAVLANYEAWLAAYEAPADMLERRSTTLYDTVAIYLAFAHLLGDRSWCDIETVPISIGDDGATNIGGADAQPVDAAVRWRDLEAFYALLVERLIAA